MQRVHEPALMQQRHASSASVPLLAKLFKTSITSAFSSPFATSAAVLPSDALTASKFSRSAADIVDSRASAASGRPWNALQCSAVHPSPSTANTSAPAFTILTINSFVSTGEPHATIKVVVVSPAAAAATSSVDSPSSRSFQIRPLRRPKMYAWTSGLSHKLMGIIMLWIITTWFTPILK
ncbi:hypothetical protein PsorP6_001407 [Peronosclerospora sorghi]|uniref:Uncharacterized protein n=1 Tax=Peronosclerospora sorghi TaxID=230839 RepID=A0ACC0WYQ4_9STRA|nr:hypothetical protein PsorP6_001407 [Peronosclerospora sorghi]